MARGPARVRRVRRRDWAGHRCGRLRSGDADLPFGSTLFAGLALGVVNGVLPTVVLVGALWRSSWAELGHIAVGVALVGWVVVQVGFLGWPPTGLQVAYFVYGWVIAGLALVGMRAQHR